MENGILIVEIPKLKEEKNENIKITIKWTTTTLKMS
jgi:HSP20 family molecular chaperone IbpA